MADKVMFGSGSLWATPSTGDQTPRRFGVLQDVSMELNYTVKELHGEYEFPIEVARGKGSISLKANYAGISAAFWNAVFFGNGVITDGYDQVAELEAGVIPAAAGPYTVNVANAATFKEDLGVFFADTAVQLKRVAAAPAAGEYTVTPAGQYTFAAADAEKAVLFTYRYTVANAGQTLAINNQRLGSAPDFGIHLYSKFKGNPVTFKLYRAMGTKLTFGTKQEDFTIPNFEGKVMADSLNRIGTLAFGWK